uniref:Uncharacterized protein n=1 Tax=Parascaris equorum TaxID=6256 RepID=A0A914RMT2_PAREQ
MYIHLFVYLLFIYSLMYLFIYPSSKYGDFHTIDWQQDLARDRLRHRYILGHKKEFPFGTIYGMWDAGSGWICDGVCADRFWLDREHCCWSANDSVYKDADCSAWTSWPEMLQYYDKNFFYYTLEVFFYCGWSVLMAAVTVTLVKVRRLICFLCCLSFDFFGKKSLV